MPGPVTDAHLGRTDRHDPDSDQPGTPAPSAAHPAKLSPFLSTPLKSNTTAIVMEVSIDSPRSDADTTPWVGGTGLGNMGLGKSGRVIERLMAENDRLRREMKAEIAKREELQRTVQTNKPKLEALQSENSRLSNIKTMDDNVIRRRDRKIEEMRVDLDTERSKRESAERRATEAEQVRDDERNESRQALQSEREMARHATAHADILQTSHQQLSKEYRQRIAGANKALRDLQGEKDEDRKRMARLDVVLGQMRQEAERMRRVHGELVSMWGRFEEQKTREVEGLVEQPRKLSGALEEQQRGNVQLAEDMVEVMNKMRWVLRMESLTKGTDSPPPSPGEAAGTKAGGGGG